MPNRNSYQCINDTTVEQIVLAWHGYVEIEPVNVDFFEAMKSLNEGRSVKYKNSPWFDRTDDLEDSIDNIYTTWSELIEGEWQVK